VTLLGADALPAGASGVSADARDRAASTSGWLFEAREFEPAGEPSGSDLDAIVEGLTTGAGECAALGLRYLPVLVPAKRTFVKAAPPRDRSWIAELNARLRDVDEVELMGLLSVLRHAARHGRCYQRTDAHWNALGAFFVARALLKEAHKTVAALRPAPLAELHLRPVGGYRGPLSDAPLLELAGGERVDCEVHIPAEDGVVIDASRLRARRMPVEPALAQAESVPVRIYAAAEADEGARLAVVGAAAALPVVVWLAEQARRIAFFSSRTLPPAQLEMERPPIVIHLIDETDLLRGWPPGKATRSQATAAPAARSHTAETGLGWRPDP